MTDTVNVQGEGSPESVAFKLLQIVYGMEPIGDRKKLLDAYAECLQAARGARKWQAG